MAEHSLLSQIAIFTILGISYFITVEGGMIMMTNITCNSDPAVCKHKICKLETIRKGIRFLDFGCFLEEPYDNLVLRIRLQKLGKGGRTILNSAEDYCKVTANEMSATVMSRLFPSIKEHGNLFSKCPIEGNMTLLRYPLDFSFVPIFMTPGNYLLTGIIDAKQATGKLPYIRGDLNFYVRNSFKNH